MKILKKSIYKKSKYFHKVAGLFLIIPLIWISISGILLNHKELIKNINTPNFLIPKHYKDNNLNRASLIDLIKIKNNTLIAGKRGIFKVDSNNNLINFSKGLDRSNLYKKTWDLHYSKSLDKIFAATEGGLYYLSKNNTWKKINLKNKFNSIRKILEINNKIYIFANSNIFYSNGDLNFKELITNKVKNDNHTMIELFFTIHSGEIWGSVGKLIFDLTGLIIIFLSISAFYIFYIPKKNKKDKKDKKNLNFYYKYHNRLGILFILPIIIISFTAIFMRPPLIILITDSYTKFYPAIKKNIWHKKIENALFDKSRNKLLIQCSDGIWSSSFDINNNLKPFIKEKFIPYFVMGASYFEVKNNKYIFGSFSGLFEYNIDTNKIYDLINKKYVDSVSRVRPNRDYMINSYFEYKNKKYLSTHFAGIKDMNGNVVKLFKNTEILNDVRLPLFNWLFELHNGRIFRVVLGKLYIILVPIISILFFLVLLSGLYDYFYYKKRK